MTAHIQRLKVISFFVCLAPLASYLDGIYSDTLGANPIEALTRGLGTWALNFLMITLAITPFRRLSGWTWLLRLRRMLGLYCFFYAALHLGAYLWLDQFFDWAAIVQDIFKRPFITVGMLTFVLLLPLAVTSNQASLRRLGGRRWQSLHRATYLIALLAVLHYTWMVKADIASPVMYASLLAMLLGIRAYWRFKDARQPPASGRAIPRSANGRRVIPLVIRK